MITTSHLRRGSVAAAGAALLTLGATASASGPDTANGSEKGASPDVAAVSSAFPPGSELQFVAVAPCRIIDTRQEGGALTSGSRAFDATLASYSGQGGKSGSCGIPDVAVSVQLNLGAISRQGKTSDIKGWATGTSEPTASLVNYNPAGPVANMVTMPVNGTGRFTLKTPGSAHVFADVAGYYVKPLYVAVAPDGAVYSSTASGVVGTTRISTGRYAVTFNRDVERCSAVASDLIFSGTRDISTDTGFSGDANTVTVQVTNSTNVPEDTYYSLSLTC